MGNMGKDNLLFDSLKLDDSIQILEVNFLIFVACQFFVAMYLFSVINFCIWSVNLELVLLKCSLLTSRGLLPQSKSNDRLAVALIFASGLTWCKINEIYCKMFLVRVQFPITCPVGPLVLFKFRQISEDILLYGLPLRIWMQIRPFFMSNWSWLWFVSYNRCKYS